MIKNLRYQVQSYGKEVDTWLNAAIGRPCNLLCHLSSSYCIRLDKRDGAGTCRESRTCLNFSNGAQFLLVSEESVADLNNRLNSKPNLIISGGRPFAEDEWRNIKICFKYFRTLGGCNRYQIINFAIDAEQVLKTDEPLASYRRVKGKILFGILLRYECEDEGNTADLWLQVGESMIPGFE